MERNIIRSMHNANYCTVNNDCALVSYACPFGCGSYINKEKTAQISKMVSSYFKLQSQLKMPRCVYGCNVPVTPVCQSGQCVPKSCELNKEYKSKFPDNCSCPTGSKSIIKPPKLGQGVFECVAGTN
jgi:hypothetical protein